MWFSYLFYFVVAAISVAAAVGVVASNKPVHSALFLLANFAMLAALYITMDAQFLGAVQIIIYAGGIVILILFVIMLIGSQGIEMRGGPPFMDSICGDGAGVAAAGGTQLQHGAGLCGRGA